MIYFDVTKSAKSRHVSGLMRVNRKLQQELGGDIVPVVWGQWDHHAVKPDDWYFTTEIFDVVSRPGFADFLRSRTCQLAALFPDAIPLKFPRIVWPHSVARHPHYMHALSRFDHVFAISEAVRRDLEEFWRWQGNETSTEVSVLPLGADFDGSPRRPQVTGTRAAELVCIGILEPRKNQAFLMKVAESLWADGVEFKLHLIGRVNPHFGRSIADHAQLLSSRHRDRFQYHAAATDVRLADLLGRARAVVFPTIAEGCGLPVLESLWRGLPCVCSDLPVLLENTDGGGCVPLPVNDIEEWKKGLKRLLEDDAWWLALAQEAAARSLPTWADSANQVRRTLC